MVSCPHLTQEWPGLRRVARATVAPCWNAGEGRRVEEHLSAHGEEWKAIDTLEDYLRAMQNVFAADRARGKRAVLQYVFSGRVSGACYAVVDDGVLQAAVGTHSSPTATVEVDFDLWMQVLSYKIDGLMAYQEGRFRVLGDVEALMESDTWFVR